MNEPDLLAQPWSDIRHTLTGPPAQTKPQPEPAGVPRLSPGETWLLYITVVLLLAVGIIGLAASFQSVTTAARSWGFNTPELLPIAVDLAIPGFTIANLLLIRMNMELAWVRAVPWALTGVTVYLNIQAGNTLPAKIGHGALPLVWVVCSEVAANVYRVIIGAVTGRRMERVRRSRWFLAPLSTASLWRRMILWEETSYLAAVRRERDRKLARAGLRETYGLAWRFRAPLRDRVLLRMGDLNPAGLTETEATETETARETSASWSPSTTETGLPALPPAPAETETSRSPETETSGETAIPHAETKQTETIRTAPRKTTVSALGDRDPQTEIETLLALMRDRKSETAVGLKEAIDETGRPKATAAKRLRAARDLYLAETA